MAFGVNVPSREMMERYYYEMSRQMDREVRMPSMLYAGEPRKAPPAPAPDYMNPILLLTA